jgi:hypothetical protein
MLKQFSLGLMLSTSIVAAAQQTVLPLIVTVQENAVGTQITINGTGFGTVKPSVNLGTTSLNVVSFSDKTITAALPSGISPGSFLLSVVNGGTHLSGLFVAEIGPIQGPPGPQGVAGSAGPQGTKGLTGAAGPIGPQGLAGSPGAQGPAGPTGPQGQTGVIGPAGAPGAEGPAGPIGPQGLSGATGAAGPQLWTAVATFFTDVPANYGGSTTVPGGWDRTTNTNPSCSTCPQVMKSKARAADNSASSTTASISLVVPAAGFSNSGVAGANYQEIAGNNLPFPRACTLTGFAANLSNVDPTNQNQIDITLVTQNGNVSYDLCQITPSSTPTSCTSAVTASFNAGDEVVLAVSPLQNGDDTELDGTQLATSFTCQ